MKTYNGILIGCGVFSIACGPQYCPRTEGGRCTDVLAASGSIARDGASGRTAAQPNSLTDAEQRAGWRLLFDGRTFKGWRGLGYDTVPTAHWKIENGTIRKLADGDVPRLPDGQPAAGGDLMTIDTFRDFELSWEWKISRAGNSGVKYNVSEEISMANAPNHAALGFEYQMLDDSLHEDNKVPSHRAGALYDLIPPSANKTLKPVGEWNSSTIVFRGNHGEHWLNGRRVVEFDLGTPRMDSLLAVSKYKSIPNFAQKRAGHIVLQNHVDEVFFRNIRIRSL
jgi:3-keto-disaccharide hydrolase